MPFAQNDLVRLRRLGAQDLGAFQAYRGDPVVGQFQGWTAMDRDQALGFLSDMAVADVPCVGGWCQIGIADAATDLLIGDLGVHLSADQSEVELGITLSRLAQGKNQGYAAVRLVTQWIFANTKAAKIAAITDVRNTGAQALLTRLGWPHVGTLGPEEESVGCTEYVFECLRLPDN